MAAPAGMTAPRARLETDRARRPRSSEVNEAIAIVDRSGVVPVLSARLDRPVGRPRSLSVKGLLVAMVLNGLADGHQAQIRAIAATLNALTGQQRRDLGIRNWDPREAYRRTDRLFNKLAQALDDTWSAEVDGHTVTIDGDWLLNRLAPAGIDPNLPASGAVAVDGTAVPTTARLHFGDAALAFDGDQTVKEAADQTGSTGQASTRTVTTFGVGADGRTQWTKDPDARGGYRTATDRKPGGYYVGYELHLGVAVADLVSTNHVDEISFADQPPAYVTVASIAAAGTHRGAATVPALQQVQRDTGALREVIVDPGYSMLRPERFLLPLRHAGIDVVFKPVTHQLGRRLIDQHTITINGQLFSRHTPAELGGEDGQHLALPGHDATPTQRQASQHQHDRRARFRLTRHSRPDADGYARYKCPFCAGLVWNRDLGRRRARKHAPQVALRDHATTCCGGTTTYDPYTAALHQRIPAGTTAWTASYNRRNRVEMVNGQLKGKFVDLEAPGFLHVFGRTKRALLLAATLAGYNAWTARSHRRKLEAANAQPARRAKRRQHAYPATPHSPSAASHTSHSGPDPPRRHPPS